MFWGSYKYGVGVSFWRLLVHDWTKFLPSELPHYQRQFFGKADDPVGFMGCWLRHQNRHEHHWEFWVPRSGHSRCDPPYLDNEPIPMSLPAIREMVADWIGAGRAYQHQWPDISCWGWLVNNVKRMQLHPETVEGLRQVLLGMPSYDPAGETGVALRQYGAAAWERWSEMYGTDKIMD